LVPSSLRQWPFEIGKGAGMSTVMAANNAANNAGDIRLKLEFNKNLNQVSNKIHATGNVDEIMLDVSRDICALFNADRLTVYVVGDDNISLVSKVKTGLNSFKDLKLPIAEQSLAGYAAMHKKLLNVKDVYDEKELAKYSAQLRFLQGGGQAHRIPHQADVGRADSGLLQWRSRWSNSGHQ